MNISYSHAKIWKCSINNLKIQKYKDHSNMQHNMLNPGCKKYVSVFITSKVCLNYIIIIIKN